MPPTDSGRPATSGDSRLGRIGGIDVLTRQALAGLRVRDVMTRDPVTVVSAETVEQVMDETIHQHRHTTYPVVENGTAVGLLPFASIARVPRWEWDERHIGDCMLPRADVPVLTEEESAVDALAELQTSDVGHAPLRRATRRPARDERPRARARRPAGGPSSFTGVRGRGVR
jgi:predicted transcriptional regulator